MKNKVQMILDNDTSRRSLGLMLLMMCCVFAETTLAGDTIGTVADNVTQTFKDIAELVTAGAYLAGAGFVVASLLKFKQHKDNPTQIPIGTPIALLFIGAALVFMPTLIGVAGETVFGSTKTGGTVKGMSTY